MYNLNGFKFAITDDSSAAHGTLEAQALARETQGEITETDEIMPGGGRNFTHSQARSAVTSHLNGQQTNKPGTAGSKSRSLGGGGRKCNAKIGENLLRAIKRD